MDLNKYSWVAWLLTSISWVVTYFVYKFTGLRTESNKVADNLLSQLHELEDLSLQYWINKSDDVFPYQLNLKLKRVASSAKELETLNRDWSYPKRELVDLRQSITLNIERDPRPVDEYSVRARQIMSSIVDLEKKVTRKL